MFTRRQKHALLAFLALYLASLFVPQYLLDQHQTVLLLLIVLPIGFYIATDPEART